jgi:hypothetical protein
MASSRRGPVKALREKDQARRRKAQGIKTRWSIDGFDVVVDRPVLCFGKRPRRIG